MAILPYTQDEHAQGPEQYKALFAHCLVLFHSIISFYINCLKKNATVQSSRAWCGHPFTLLGFSSHQLDTKYKTLLYSCSFLYMTKAWKYHAPMNHAEELNESAFYVTKLPQCWTNFFWTVEQINVKKMLRNLCRKNCRSVISGTEPLSQVSNPFIFVFLHNCHVHFLFSSVMVSHNSGSYLYLTIE